MIWQKNWEIGIDSIEIYYNPATTEMDHNLKGAVYYDIITRKEV